MKKDDVIMWEQFIVESPWMSAPLPDAFDEKMLSISVEEIKQKYDFIEKFINGEVYGKRGQLFFVRDEEFLAYYQYEQFQDYIQTKMSWSRKGNNGIFRTFFGDYIIPKFKVVESDYGLTPLAFDMWKKLIIMYPNYDFYAKDEGKLYPLVNPEEVYTFNDPITKDENSTFIVQYRE